MVLKQSMSYGFVRHYTHCGVHLPLWRAKNSLHSVLNLSANHPNHQICWCGRRCRNRQLSDQIRRQDSCSNVELSPFNFVLRKCKEKVCSVLAPYMFYICIATEGGPFLEQEESSLPLFALFSSSNGWSSCGVSI